jgi:itaconate CoA-transferase
MLPLDGVTVVAVEQAVAAPLASRHLADLGARVIKIERPGEGDFSRSFDTAVKGLSSHFVWLNRSKQSFTLDLKHPEAKQILKALLARADVFLHNLMPGAMGRLGFDAKAVGAAWPRLIVCEISGYGSSGPFSRKKAYDLLVQNEAGVVSITGAEDAPAKVGISVADIAAGMYAFSGILAALLARTRSGEGAFLEVSMFEALAEWMGYPAYYAGYGGTAPRRSGANHATIAPYGPYAASDSRVVCLAVQNHREWVRFCTTVLEKPDVSTDPRFDSNPRRVEHRQALDAIINDCFGRLTSADLIARLEKAQIANARMNSVREFLDHPQLAVRQRWRDVQSPAGPLRALIPPINLEGAELPMGAIPALGEHTAAILAELGFDETAADTLRRAGVV